MKEYYELGEDPPPDPKAKKKPALKKGEVAVPDEMVEKLTNENGITLPVVFKDYVSTNPSSTAATTAAAAAAELGPDGEEPEPQFKGYQYPRTYHKIYATNPTGFDENAIDDSNPLSPKQMLRVENSLSGKGKEIDHYICCAYRSVKQFAPSIIAASPVASAGGDGGVATQSDFRDNYLWRAIYPKLPSGKMLCYFWLLRLFCSFSIAAAVFYSFAVAATAAAAAAFLLPFCCYSFAMLLLLSRSLQLLRFLQFAVAATAAGVAAAAFLPPFSNYCFCFLQFAVAAAAADAFLLRFCSRCCFFLQFCSACCFLSFCSYCCFPPAVL
jgi:hypothetical protein